MFDTLRLELAPFGVTVTSVVTGPVKSAIHTHDNLTNMPENSLYADVQDLVMRRSKGEDGSPRMDTMQYANGVVNKVLKGGNAKIWSGANMWILRLIVTWMPISVLVCIILTRAVIDYG
jgi:1-acylglycerone phosphate reductase